MTGEALSTEGEGVVAHLINILSILMIKVIKYIVAYPWAALV